MSTPAPAAMTVRLKGATPWRGREQREAAGLPIDFANVPWKFVHYPEGWEFDEVLGFIPALSQISAKPGCNGVGDDYSTARADAGAMKKGGRIIDPTDRRLGEWADYVEFYEVVNGNKHFCFKGSEFEVLPGRQARQRDGSASLREFRAYLRDNGLVDGIPEAAFNKLLDIEEKGLTRMTRRAMQSPLAIPLVEEKKARIAKMKAAWEAPVGSGGEAAEPVETDLKPKSATKIIKAAEVARGAS